MNFRRLRKVIFPAVAVLLSVPGAVRAANHTYNIDTPTTGMLDYGSYDLSFRLISQGGIIPRLTFGVFRIINLGMGWELDKVIGQEDVVVSPPTVFVKIRPFRGGAVLPAFSFGYDGQGYFYDKDRNEYIEEEKGVYFVFGREYFFPGFEINVGANMNDFRTNKVYGFLGASINLEDKFLFIAEYDNVNTFPEARINAGVRFAIVDSLSIDLAGRDIGTSRLSDGTNRPAERIIRLNYNGKF